MSVRSLLPAAGVIFLAGCMVGPKYKQPAAAVPPPARMPLKRITYRPSDITLRNDKSRRIVT